MSKNTEFRNNELNHYSDKRSDEVLISEEVLINDKALSEQSVIEERYGIDPDTNMIAGVPVRHPNRHHEGENPGKRGASRASASRKSEPAPVGNNDRDSRAHPGLSHDTDAVLPPVMRSELYYYLLVISKKQSKLFKGTGQGLTFIDVPGMPLGVEDVVHIEEKDGQNLIRSGTGSKGGAVYHGTGSSRPDDKTNIAMYLAEVDSTIRKDVLRSENAPMLLAGVGYVVSAFRSASRYQHIWPDALTGSHEFDTETELHSAAIELVREYFERPKDQALAVYANKSHTDLTSFILDDVIRAAHYKKIDTLFVDKRARLRGSFNEETDLLIVHASDTAGDVDLIDLTISKTRAAGGEVFMLDAKEMPVNRMMAAIMRYK